jgi:hypothetical protein
MATKKPSNPFDAIAKAAPAAKKSASNKIAAEVTDEISNAVDLIISHKAEVKRLEAEMEEHGDKVRDHVFKQQASHARKGNYSKTFDVKGHVGNLVYVASDRWTLPKEAEVQEALQKIIGNKLFDEWFHNLRTIKVKEAVTEDQEKIGNLVKAMTDAKLDIADYFDVTDALKSKKDMDKDQFELEDKVLAQFRTVCKQYKAGLK